jgi:energy-coupling factor transport system ATP-binding protein
VWEPELAVLARIAGAPRVPRDAEEAAELIVARDWRRESAAAAAPGRTVLEARDVRYRYPRATRDAVAGISLTLAEAQCVAIVGPNGAGKSTLGLLLAGVLRPDGGSVTLRGRPAYVFQYPEHQFVAQTVRDDLLFGAGPGGLARERASELLERFGLAALAEANPYSLSHGEKRRLSVATALMGDPDVLLLDEPTFGQDRRNAETLGRIVDDRVRDGKSVALITHDLSFVASHASRVIALNDGRVAFDGTPRELFARDDLMRRCRLVPPPIAAAFQAARAGRPDVPLVINGAELRAAAAPPTVPA